MKDQPLITRQIEFMRRRDLGFNKENVLSIRLRDNDVIQKIPAFPLSMLFIHMRLENFAYRTAIDPLLLVAAVLGAILVALVTASYHSIKVAQMNPADNLRCE